MRIISISIKDGFDSKMYSFSSYVNLILSDKNTVGKTTLLRLILFSLGYSVPGTKRMRFEHVETICEIELDDGRKIKLTRKGKDYIDCDVDGKTYILPNDMLRLQTLIFRTENEEILENVLGAFYCDQEKGWTLLNRGNPIGKNKFNIESLIRGLSDVVCDDLLELEARYTKDIARLESMLNVSEYQRQISEQAGGFNSISEESERRARIANSILLKKTYTRQLMQVNSALKDNARVGKMITEMNIVIQDNQGNLIPVTKENILGYSDSIDYLVSQKKHLVSLLANIDKEICAIERDSRKEEEQLLLFEEESFYDKYETAIMRVPIDAVAAKKKVEETQKVRRRVRDEISSKTRSNSKVLNSLYDNVFRYMNELGVKDADKIACGYIFTSNLKELSGAELHKTVFAFRLAYISEIQKKLNIKLPIILDSPRGKEVDDANIQKMMSILMRDFPDNQIIIASIYNYDFDNPKVIKIEERLMEQV